MIRVENIEVWGFEHAIRGARNPMNSWSKSDSHTWEQGYVENCDRCFKRTLDNIDTHSPSVDLYCIGPNDLGLMQRLFKAGTEHRKYLRQIFVSMDITAPLYFWKQIDQYKVGIVTNSCSTMHRIAAKPFELNDFSYEHLLVSEKLETIIQWLNDYREMYVNWDDSSVHVDDYGNVVKKKDIWWQMIQLLPSSYNQRRTITMNYENVFTIIHQRTGHKLDEWNTFVEILKTLPYVKEIGGLDEESS